MTTESPAPPPPPPPPPSMLRPPTIRVQEVAKSVHVKGNSQTLFSLTQAIEEDSLAKMSALIELKGVSVNSTLSYGIPILLKAIRSRSNKIVEYLIERDADPELSIRDMMKRPDGLEVEYSYVKRFDQWCIDILKKLLPKLGQRLHDIVDSEGRTLLHLACFFPDVSIFEYLLRFGLNPNILDNRGTSVLSLLMSYQDARSSFEMVQLILSQPHVTVDVRNVFGSTPLYQSFLMNRMDMFYFLLEKGADPYIQTYSGNTLMHCPFLHSNKYLLLYDLGLDVNVANKAGLKALQNKAELGFDFFVLVLLGRVVSNEEFSKMEKNFTPSTVMRIRERSERNEFSSMRLQALCRRTIRMALFKHNHYNVADNIWHLPLPKPLRLYLDVNLYAQHLLDALSQ